jgi:ComF family protein
MPVPISKKRLKQRGYNQSSLFAKELAKYLQIEYEEKILIKIKDNNAQSSLNEKERVKNVHGVYRIKNKQKIYNKKILIVDDIFTTGNTVNECAKLLIENKAKNVGVFTIAKD